MNRTLSIYLSRVVQLPLSIWLVRNAEAAAALRADVRSPLPLLPPLELRRSSPPLRPSAASAGIASVATTPTEFCLRVDCHRLSRFWECVSSQTLRDAAGSRRYVLFHHFNIHLFIAYWDAATSEVNKAYPRNRAPAAARAAAGRFD